jgi:hypothetical protein
LKTKKLQGGHIYLENAVPGAGDPCPDPGALHLNVKASVPFGISDKDESFKAKYH